MKSCKRLVLCVDDDPDSCELLKVVLSKYEFMAAHSLGAGLRQAQSRAFDIYILDNIMPDGTGVELCRLIRQFDRNTPILFISGAAFENDHTEALEAGAQAYLNKPVNLIHLEGVVYELIAKAEFRRIDARVAERAAISDELAQRFVEQKEALQQISAFISAAEESLIRIKAYQAFSSAGGTRADFERLWPAAFEEALD